MWSLDLDIWHGALHLVGRGTIREAPETVFARESREREVIDTSGSLVA